MSRFCLVLAMLLLSLTAHANERPATVLLITSDTLRDAWKPWAAWKTRQGKPTVIYTVEEIAKTYNGKDIQAKIRACVLAHIELRATRWIVLGGDSQPGAKGHVPHRATPHRALRRPGRQFVGPDKIEVGGGNIPTDLYYISPRGKDWDANDDGIYGAWPADKDAIAYTHPSGACIARIPLKTVADVQAYTAKVIGYESRYPTQGFAKKFMYTNTVRQSEPKVRKSWDANISKAWKGGEALRFFYRSSPWDTQDSKYALKEGNWVEKLNQKTASKMHMHGHGMPTFWVLEGPEGRSMVSKKTIEKLNNKDGYVIVTTVSCFTGQFDTVGDPCIAESMLRAKDKGAIIMLAPSRSGIPVFHNPRTDFMLMMTQGKMDGTTESFTRFWMNGLTQQSDGGYLTAGEAWARTKKDMTRHAVKTEGYHMVQCELNLLGDPTLDLRAKDPITPQVEAEAMIAKGAQTYEVQTTAGLTVCLWKGSEIYLVQKADANGLAKFEISPKSGGKLLLTVSGANANSVTRDVIVLNN